MAVSVLVNANPAFSDGVHITGNGIPEAGQPSNTNAYAYLVYTDEYISGLEVSALSLRARMGEPADAVVLVGCTPATDALASPEKPQVEYDDPTGSGPKTCVPTVSQSGLQRLRALASQWQNVTLRRRFRARLNAWEPELRSLYLQRNWNESMNAFQHLSTSASIISSMDSGQSQPRAGQGYDVSRLRIAFVPWLFLHQGVEVIGLNEGVWMKLHAWALVDYQCVFLLDTDQIVRRNLDWAFHLDVCRRDTPKGDITAATLGSNECVFYWCPLWLPSLFYHSLRKYLTVYRFFSSILLAMQYHRWNHFYRGYGISTVNCYLAINDASSCAV
jgi:hypothetical protein